MLTVRTRKPNLGEHALFWNHFLGHCLGSIVFAASLGGAFFAISIVLGLCVSAIPFPEFWPDPTPMGAVIFAVVFGVAVILAVLILSTTSLVGSFLNCFTFRVREIEAHATFIATQTMGLSNGVIRHCLLQTGDDQMLYIQLLDPGKEEFTPRQKFHAVVTKAHGVLKHDWSGPEIQRHEVPDELDSGPSIANFLADWARYRGAEPGVSSDCHGSIEELLQAIDKVRQSGVNPFN